MNYQVFVGNVLRDPELRATKSGLSKTTLSVAINEGDREKGTEKAHSSESTSWAGPRRTP